LNLYPTYHPTGGVQVLQKAWNLLSDDVKASLQSAESLLKSQRRLAESGSFKLRQSSCSGQGGHGHHAREQDEPFDRKFLEAPFAGKHPKLINKGTKAAAAEAAVTAAETIAVADLEEA
jgi:hypothetical protein